MKYGLKIVAIISLLAIAACTAINTSRVVVTSSQARWGMAIFANNTEVPQAGYRAMSITQGVLRSMGVNFISVFPPPANCNKLIVCPNATPRVEEVLRWARSRNMTYVMMGQVNEWDYKVGLDGEPIAGVALQLYYVKSGTMIWSAVGSRSGTSRSGLAVVAQVLINDILGSLKIA